MRASWCHWFADQLIGAVFLLRLELVRDEEHALDDPRRRHRCRLRVLRVVDEKVEIKSVAEQSLLPLPDIVDARVTCIAVVVDDRPVGDGVDGCCPAL